MAVVVFANHRRGLNEVKSHRISPSPMIPTTPSYNGVRKSRRMARPPASCRDDVFDGPHLEAYTKAAVRSTDLLCHLFAGPIDDIWESRLDVSETFVPHQHIGQALFIGRDA
jgi:hypothetical protein